MSRWLPFWVIGILVAGCSTSSQPDVDSAEPSRAESSSTSASAEPEPEPVPDLQPIKGASPTAERPGGLKPTPRTSDVVRSSAQSDPSRLAAETFALKLSQMLMHTRSAEDLAGLLDTVGTDGLSPEVRASLVGDAESQARLDLGRRWKTEDPMWIRSQVLESDGVVRRVNVQVAGTIAIKDPTYIGWNIIRLDIVRNGNSWKLAAVSAGPVVVDDPLIDRATVVLGDQLKGVGWREITPAT